MPELMALHQSPAQIEAFRVSPPRSCSRAAVGVKLAEVLEGAYPARSRLGHLLTLASPKSIVPS
jgi:hypothetical protein